MMKLESWIEKHGITQEAIDDLNSVIVEEAPENIRGEMEVIPHVKLQASRLGVRLWRNNCGAAVDANGRHIRYGLANDSARLNRVLKSGDLIGITPVVVVPEMVGHRVGVFTSYEVKRQGWQYTATPIEVAQKTWNDTVTGMGGIAKFITDESGVEAVWHDIAER